MSSDATSASKWPRRMTTSALSLAAVTFLALIIAGPGYQIGAVGLRPAFLILAFSALTGLLTLVVGASALLLNIHGPSSTRWACLVATVFGVLITFNNASWLTRARSVPPIHDISTDLDDPPAFVDVAALRADAPNPASYAGAEVADQQREGYPDLQSLTVGMPADECFEHAAQAARDMGWTMVAEVPEEGRIEATATTFWFGFKDDVVIRIRNAAGGSRVDVRSKSRVGMSDVGTNAARIQDYLSLLAESA